MDISSASWYIHLFKVKFVLFKFKFVFFTFDIRSLNTNLKLKSTNIKLKSTNMKLKNTNLRLKSTNLTLKRCISSLVLAGSLPNAVRSRKRSALRAHPFPKGQSRHSRNGG